VIAHELANAPGHQRAYARVGPDRRRLPQADLAEAPVTRERFRQNHFAVVARTGEERHYRHLIRFQFVQHGVEPGLTLMKRDRHLVVEPATAQRLGDPPSQGVGFRMASRAMSGED
jgi:hypothetical protein